MQTIHFFLLTCWTFPLFADMGICKNGELTNILPFTHFFQSTKAFLFRVNVGSNTILHHFAIPQKYCACLLYDILRPS